MMTLVTRRSECHWNRVEGRSPARWPFVLWWLLKGPTGPGVRRPAFFGGRRGAELGEGNQVLVCWAWDGRLPERGGLVFQAGSRDEKNRVIYGSAPGLL